MEQALICNMACTLHSASLSSRIELCVVLIPSHMPSPCCRRYRVPNLVMRIYRRSRAWALAFFAISIILVFYVRIDSCAAYVETWLGLAPIQFIMTGLALNGAFLAMPTRPDKKHEASQVSS